jgi:hypothetical protein
MEGDPIPLTAKLFLTVAAFVRPCHVPHHAQVMTVSSSIPPKKLRDPSKPA